MNKQNLKGFNNEIQKEALFPVSWVKGLTKLKVLRAGVKGEKALVREAGRVASKAARTGGKEVGATGQVDDIVAAMKNTRIAKGQGVIDAAVKEPTKAVGGGLLSKHKGKLLIGGAVAGGLYLASKPEDQEEAARKKARMALRNMNIPQRVYYN